MRCIDAAIESLKLTHTQKPQVHNKHTKSQIISKKGMRKKLKQFCSKSKHKQSRFQVNIQFRQLYVCLAQLMSILFTLFSDAMPCICNSVCCTDMLLILPLPTEDFDRNTYSGSMPKSSHHCVPFFCGFQYIRIPNTNSTLLHSSAFLSRIFKGQKSSPKN